MQNEIFSGFKRYFFRLIEIKRAGDQVKPAAPSAMPGQHDDSDGDWVVYETSDSSSAATMQSGRYEIAAAALSIDWDAEAGDINFLIPPLLAGRTGMRHGTRK